MLLSTAKSGFTKPSHAWDKPSRAMNFTYQRLIVELRMLFQLNSTLGLHAYLLLGLGIFRLGFITAL
jgi:hypothetical protein